jgi:hypothetical protein
MISWGFSKSISFLQILNVRKRIHEVKIASFGDACKNIGKYLKKPLDLAEILVAKMPQA